VLLYVVRNQLHFEVAGILLCDFLEPPKKRLQACQRVDLIDLLVQALQFF
jgi:hypothetical protein